MSRTDSLVDRIQTTASLGSTLPAYTNTLGISLEPIANAVGIDISRFSSYSARVSLDRMCRLFEALATLSDDPAFGLHLADRSRGGITGAYAYGLISAPTLLDALRFTERHIRMVMDVQRMALDVGTRMARLEWRISPLIVRSEQFMDYFSALHALRLGEITGNQARVLRYHLQRPKPERVQLYRELFSPQIEFGQAMMAVECPVDTLAIENPTGDPKLFRVMNEQCAQLAPPAPDADDPIAALRLLIADTLEDQPLTLDQAASFTGLSARTLQRRLAEQHTTLNDMIDRTRQNLARRLIEDSDMSIAAIGYRLGFSQQSAFTRSARRWFGTSPSAMRKQAHARKS